MLPHQLKSDADDTHCTNKLDIHLLRSLFCFGMYVFSGHASGTLGDRLEQHLFLACFVHMELCTRHGGGSVLSCWQACAHLSCHTAVEALCAAALDCGSLQAPDTALSDHLIQKANAVLDAQLGRVSAAALSNARQTLHGFIQLRFSPGFCLGATLRLNRPVSCC